MVQFGHECEGHSNETQGRGKHSEETVQRRVEKGKKLGSWCLNGRASGQWIHRTGRERLTWAAMRGLATEHETSL